MKKKNFQFPYREKEPVRDPKEGEKFAYNIRQNTLLEEERVFNPRFNWENYLANKCSLHKHDIHNMKAAGYLSLDSDGKTEILDGQGYSMNPRDEDGRILYFSHEFMALEFGRALDQYFKKKDFYCREFRATKIFPGGIEGKLLQGQKQREEAKERVSRKTK